MELGHGAQSEDIGQVPDWQHGAEAVDMLTIDGLSLPRADLMKIDVEGMELDVLEGATGPNYFCAHASSAIVVFGGEEVGAA